MHEELMKLLKDVKSVVRDRLDSVAESGKKLNVVLQQMEELLDEAIKKGKK